ncbi:hypothetical protein ACROYT_G015131 [Oculina patagonica]
MRKLLLRAREAKVKFNPAKLQYKVSEVKYMGNIVSESGLKPDVEKVRAIIQMPFPQYREELRRFLGMVNYFSQFISNQSEATAPLQSLLKKDVVWIWSHEHTQAVEHLKEILSSQPILKFFDPSKPVNLLQRLLLRLQKYEVNNSYVPGKYMYVADTLSRAFLNEQPTDDDLNDDMEVMVHSLIINLPMTQEKLAQMKSATAQDEDLQKLCKVVKNGWPSHRSQLPASVAHY